MSGILKSTAPGSILNLKTPIVMEHDVAPYNGGCLPHLAHAQQKGHGLVVDLACHPLCQHSRLSTVHGRRFILVDSSDASTLHPSLTAVPRVLQDKQFLAVLKPQVLRPRGLNNAALFANMSHLARIAGSRHL